MTRRVTAPLIWIARVFVFEMKAQPMHFFEYASVELAVDDHRPTTTDTEQLVLGSAGHDLECAERLEARRRAQARPRRPRVRRIHQETRLAPKSGTSPSFTRAPHSRSLSPSEFLKTRDTPRKPVWFLASVGSPPMSNLARAGASLSDGGVSLPLTPTLYRGEREQRGA
jgi:hypothetical protein